MIRSFLRVFLIGAFVAFPIRAQTDGDSSSDDKPKDAHIKIINACDTSQVERWRTGLDLTFKGKPIGSDIRLGERGPVGKISFTGRDTIDVYRHGDVSHALVSIPTHLQRGGFYTLVVMGQLESSSADLNVAVIEEFPLPPSSQRPGQCRIALLNTVRSYPVSLSVGNDPAKVLPFGETHEIYLQPGEVNLGLWFFDAKGKSQRLQAGMIAEAGENYTAVIHPSGERGDRPSFFQINAMEDRVTIKEMEATKDSNTSPQP